MNNYNKIVGSLWRAIFGILLFCPLFVDPAAAQVRDEPKNKAGVIHYTHTGANYNLLSNETASTVDASEPLVGAVIFYERIFQSRFSAGLKYSSFLERNMETTIDDNELVILEAVTLFNLDVKAYFSDHLLPGFKAFLGVAFGNYTVTSTVTTTSTNDDGTTTSTEGQTTATVPITVMNVGFDLMSDFGGIRIAAGLPTGKRNDFEGHTEYKAAYDYSGAVVTIGVFSFF